MTKRTDSESSLARALPSLDPLRVVARLAGDLVTVIGNLLYEDSTAVSSQRGRARLAVRLEEELWWLVKLPIAWAEASARNELAGVARRIRRIERRLVALEREEKAQAAPDGLVAQVAPAAGEDERSAADWSAGFIGLPRPKPPRDG